MKSLVELLNTIQVGSLWRFKNSEVILRIICLANFKVSESEGNELLVVYERVDNNGLTDSTKYAISISRFRDEADILDDRDMKILALQEQVLNLETEKLQLEKKLRDSILRQYY